MAQAQELREFAPGDVISERYEITRLLGSGLLGATYLAKHISSGKNVAIKFIKPSLMSTQRDRARFDAAFKAARGAKHEGLIRYGEAGEHAGIVYFTQEYFQSENLRQLLDQYQQEGKTFTLQEACQIVLKVLEPVEALHKAEIIHKNIKPENVLVQTKKLGPGTGKVVRTVKITDAGLADIVNPSIFAEGYVARDEQPYLAPELSSFEQPGTPRSDVFSVGVMLYELLVGQAPKGTYLSPTQLRGDLPEGIDDIVELAMDGEADNRYPRARDMAQNIQSAFMGDLYEDKPVASVTNVLIGVGVGVALIAAGGVYLAVSEKPDPMADARARDERMRAEIQAANKLPEREIIEQYAEQYPDMLYIPAGTFLMGRMNGEDLEVASQSEPLAKIVKTDAYLIDRFEFPNRKETDGKAQRPVGKVLWKEAEEACGKVNKRLCTEEEWEKACKGPDNSTYSYGDLYDIDKCGTGMDEPYTIGQREFCFSGYGVADMSGGFREWTATVAGSKGNRRVVKGGLRANNERGSRCAFAVDEAATYSDGTLSFRCCRDIPDSDADALGSQ